MIAALIVAVVAVSAYGQSMECANCGSEAEPAAEAVRRIDSRTRAPRPPVARRFDQRREAIRNRLRSGYPPQEKSVAVLPGVYVSFCVRRGSVKVNGWDRNEVRVFHEGGKELGIKVLERGKEKIPAWIEVLGYEPEKKPADADKCLSGEMIELDVPFGASVTLKGLSSETSMEGVKVASVEIVGGDIYLNDIAERIDASTQQGGVTVNNSSGKMAVSTTTGNIVAYNTEAVEPGDYFKAKTRSGAVTLQSIGQKEVSASTISGSINYLGEIKNYGRYEFTTTNGILNIVIPEESTFWITAAYGGRFLSDFPVKVINELDTESAFLLNGRVGAGEANLTVKSFSGTIRLRKRESPETSDAPVVP